MVTNATAKLTKLNAKIKELRALPTKTLDQELKLNTACNTRKIMLRTLDRLNSVFQREFGHQ